MAIFEAKLLGKQVTLDNHEVKVVAASLSAGSGTAALVSATLVGFGITAPASVIAALAAALLSLGSTGLNACNLRGRGIVLIVLWVGLPWCRTR